MTTASISIPESGMVFGPFPQEDCFYIEKSALYHNLQGGVKMAEFALLRQNQAVPVVWLVEAKSSSPRPENAYNFADFINEIRDKLINALSLLVNLRLQRHPQAFAELPSPFQAIELSQLQFRLVLVIRGHKPEWLPPLQDELRKVLKVDTKLWALGPNAVLVFNEEMAIRHGLIKPNSSVAE